MINFFKKKFHVFLKKKKKFHVFFKKKKIFFKKKKIPLLILSDYHSIRSVNSILREVIIGSLSILTALTFREAIVSTVVYALPTDNIRKRILFQFFLASFVMLLTILLVILWADD